MTQGFVWNRDGKGLPGVIQHWSLQNDKQAGSVQQTKENQEQSVDDHRHKSPVITDLQK
ncbi:MAG: hypothetical protein GY696_38935 [Gammaproteobacteria bacterium]|nr:hypothetical protein [Gammaproteobacteria bacterium]